MGSDKHDILSSSMYKTLYPRQYIITNTTLKQDKEKFDIFDF